MPKALISASGNAQQGRLGRMLDDPLVALVTDERGIGIGGVPVTWFTSDGRASLCTRNGLDCQTGSLVVPTEADGRSSVWPRPAALHVNVVNATVTGKPALFATFTTDVTGVRLVGSPLFDCFDRNDPVLMYNHDDERHTTVSVGTLVEFEFAKDLYPGCLARIVTTSAPPFASGFDTGNLQPGQRFQFVPKVAGTWTFTETYTGGVGTLTALPATVPNATRYGPAHIYVANADGTNAQAMVEGEWPAWSPDGTRILFMRHGFVHVMAADGSHERILTPGWQPAWAPDGQRIAMVQNEGIVVTRDDGTGALVVVRHDLRRDTDVLSDQGVGKPSWSPDGRTIVFEHLGDGEFTPAQVFLVNSDGTNARRLTAVEGMQSAESDPAWSPDGSRIALWRYLSGLSLAEQGREPTSLLTYDRVVVYGAKPAWSPDGATILFNSLRGFGSGWSIWSIAPAGGTPRVVIEDGYDAAWSPDGQRIAFVRRARLTP